MAAQALRPVLDRLGVDPAPDLEGLRDLVAAWLRDVPFDNLRKRVQLARGSLEPLDAETFLQRWLEDGTGGTCWPNADALAHVLDGVGFDVRCACGPIARPGPSGEPPPETHEPGHATVLVNLEGTTWLADGALGCPAPLRLDPVKSTQDRSGGLSWEPLPGETGVVAWAADAPTGGWRFRPVVDPTPPETMEARWQASGRASIFNGAVHASRRFPDRHLTVAGMTRRVFWHEDRRREDSVLTEPERREVLIDELGFSPRIVDALPPDTPESADALPT